MADRGLGVLDRQLGRTPGTRITATVSESRARSLTLPLRPEAATKSLSTPGRATLIRHRSIDSSVCTRGRAAHSRVLLRFLPST